MKNIQAPLLTNFWPIIFIVINIGCKSETTVPLNFEIQIGGVPLEFGKSYPVPNDSGTYSISDFKLYLTNFQLLNNESGKNYIEEDSYHLLRIQDSSQYSFVLNNVPDIPYHQIKLSIGIEEKANLSINNVGDLDPTNQMAWNWDVGYKFLLLEGLYSSKNSQKPIPLIFHVGYSENKRDYQFEISSLDNIKFIIEINELFRNPNNIDFNQISSILFNKEHSSMLSENYLNSFIRIK